MDEKQLETLQILARLRIDDPTDRSENRTGEGKRTQEFIEDLERILSLIDAMKKIDTKGVEPLTNPCDDIQRLRADEVTERDERKLLQRNAPESRAGLYLVPRVVDN